MLPLDSDSSTGLAIQVASSATDLPTSEAFLAWVNLARQGDDGEVTLRIVDEAESAQLNQQFRDKRGATNVLSFPVADLDMPLPPDVVPDLGDLVICAPLVASEAAEQKKPSLNHWAHLTLHGVLHLRGFDHQDDGQAERMENLEIDLLQQLGIANPYQTESTEFP